MPVRIPASGITDVGDLPPTRPPPSTGPPPGRAADQSEREVPAPGKFKVPVPSPPRVTLYLKRTGLIHFGTADCRLLRHPGRRPVQHSSALSTSSVRTAIALAGISRLIASCAKEASYSLRRGCEMMPAGVQIRFDGCSHCRHSIAGCIEGGPVGRYSRRAVMSTASRALCSAAISRNALTVVWHRIAEGSPGIEDGEAERGRVKNDDAPISHACPRCTSGTQRRKPAPRVGLHQQPEPRLPSLPNGHQVIGLARSLHSS